MTTLPTPTIELESISVFSEDLCVISNPDYPTSLRAMYGHGAPVPATQFVPHLELVGSPPRVIRTVVTELNLALALPRNWDSYGGKGASPTAAISALAWLADVCQPNLPAPSVVPGSDGSIQFEWHMHGVDLEVLFLPSGSREFVFEDHETGVEEEGQLGAHNSAGRSYIERILSRTDS